MKYYLLQYIPYENFIIDEFETLEELKAFKYIEYDYFVIKGEDFEIDLNK